MHRPKLKFDFALFERLWRSGVAAAEIAKIMGFGGHDRVNLLARQQGWPSRSGRARTDEERVASMADPNWRPFIKRVRKAKPSAENEKPVRQTPPRVVSDVPMDKITADVIKTGGGYTALCDVADRHDVPIQRALQIWHRVR